LQQLLQQWGEFEPGTSEHNFRIGMHDALEPAILPKLTKVLARRAPKVGFASVKIDRSNLARELSSGNIDIAIDVTIGVKKPVKQTQLWSSDFCVLMRKNHPLNGNLNKENYLNGQHISVSNRRHTNIRCQNYSAATDVVKSSDQLLTVTRMMADHLIDKNLVVVDAPHEIPNFGTSIYWHEHGEQDAALSWLRKLLLEIQSG